MNPNSAFRLAGIVPFSSVIDEPGFVLPVFTKPNSQGIYVQVPDARSEVCTDFVQVGDAGDLDLSSAVPDISCRVGAPLIFAFAARDWLEVGPIESIKGVLMGYARDHPDDTATVLQIAELVNDELLKQDDLRRKMIQNVAQSVGASASLNFAEVSVFLDGLWSALVRRAPDEKLELLTGVRRVLLLDANAKSAKIFSSQWRAWLESEIGIDVDDLRSDIRGVRRLIRSKEQATIFEELLENEVQKVRSEPRQEGRLARIVQRVMENPDVGLALIRRYRDSATFANRALELINSNASMLRWSPDAGFAHWLVDTLYTMAYPRQRGILLYELADHLGKYASFADAILNRARGSNAEAVAFAREAIEERIFRPESPKPALPPRPGYVYPSGSYRYPYLLVRPD